LDALEAFGFIQKITSDQNPQVFDIFTSRYLLLKEVIISG